MVNVPAFTTYCGLGAERIGPITAISRSCANPFASDPRSFVGAAISVILHIITTIQTSQNGYVPDFNQPKNQAQADSEWGVSTDVEECTSGTKKLLMELGINKLGEAREILYVIEIEATEHYIMSQTCRVLLGLSVSHHQQKLLDPESGSSYDDSEFSDDDDAEYLVTSAKKKIQQNLSNDEELPPQVAASARFMEAEMDVDHEKLLSGDVNFKWQRDFTAFTAVREEFFVHPVGAVKDYDSRSSNNDKQPLPNAKSKQPLAASNQPVTDCKQLPADNRKESVRKKNNNEENVDDCDERAEAGRGRVKSRGLKHRHKSKKLMSNPPAISDTVPNPNIMTKALTGKTTKIVLNLLEGLEHKGHCVAMDNFYNSPALARYLKCRGFDCLGTERLTRKNIPEDVKEMKKNCERARSLLATPAM
ncbi:PiggyBac transposable element-derived protein 4 [Eumeta japonica]|uniref:PiggyBac transposable element-derived protein 4 n=1 Tax=Eumeta variegata TaxID=151549 RepID=A0A4C1YID1_EUMVA|nr:PiggyBac transposable element-derived protein 4 [Eumeta japonica]